MDRRGDKRTRSDEDLPTDASSKRQELEQIIARHGALRAREIDLRKQLSALTTEANTEAEKFRKMQSEWRKTELESRISSLTDRITNLFSGKVDFNCSCVHHLPDQCDCACQRNARSPRAYRKMISDELEPAVEDPLLHLSGGAKMAVMHQVYRNMNDIMKRVADHHDML